MIFPEIFAPYQSKIFAGFSGKPENFASNEPQKIQKFLETQNVQPLKICLPHQTHSKVVLSAEDWKKNPEISCDGIFTDAKNTLCFVKTADCIGAIFYHPTLDIGGSIHAGWRGLEKKIFSQFLQGFSLAEISGFLVALSPSLGPCCAEFSDPYQETPGFFHPHITEISEKYFVDLWEIARQELLQSGVSAQNIHMPESCTKCGKSFSQGPEISEKFWSHRKGEKERNGTFFLMR